MNAEVDRFAASCKAHYERHGSPAAARLHALQRLKLKTVVKVNVLTYKPQLASRSLQPLLFSPTTSCGATAHLLHPGLWCTGEPLLAGAPIAVQQPGSRMRQPTGLGWQGPGGLMCDKSTAGMHTRTCDPTTSSPPSGTQCCSLTAVDRLRRHAHGRLHKRGSPIRQCSHTVHQGRGEHFGCCYTHLAIASSLMQDPQPFPASHRACIRL